MKKIFANRKRLVRILVLIVALILTVIYCIMPVGFAFVTIAPANETAGEPPEGFTSITLTTSDDIELGAWYAPPTNGVAIILVHGAGDGRQSVRQYATMLHDNGFGVLAINLRGYGDSEGDINRLGWYGTEDVGAAMTYLAQQDEVLAIGGLGISLGAEVLLGASSTYPEIRAIVSDGATARTLEEYTDLAKNRPIHVSLPRRIWYVATELISGDTPPEISLTESMQQTPDTNYLFIAAENDEFEVDYNKLFHNTVMDRSELWIVSDVNHTGGFNRYRDEYTERVLTFLADNLLNNEQESVD